jgi:hypothetical protein
MPWCSLIRTLRSSYVIMDDEVDVYVREAYEELKSSILQSPENVGILINFTNNERKVITQALPA